MHWGRTKQTTSHRQQKINLQNSEDKMGLWLQLRIAPGREAGTELEAGTLRQHAEHRKQGSRDRLAT